MLIKSHNLLDTQMFKAERVVKRSRGSKMWCIKVVLDRTGHMSVLTTGQDRTPTFAGQVLPDRTESGLIFLNILPTKYRLSILIR
jgi:hypothetical protein